jgi:hypothetical protein
MDSEGEQTDRFPKREAVLLFHDTFLSGGTTHIICVDKWTKEWLSRVTPLLNPWEGASL